MRHRQNMWIFAAVVPLALCLAAPAEAATKSKHKKKPAAGTTTTQPATSRRTATAQPGFRMQGGVPAGPLYNGRDYLGDDPDPNIRSQILRDMGGRYGGND